VLRLKNSKGSSYQLSLTGNSWSKPLKVFAEADEQGAHSATQLSTVNHSAMRCRQNSHVRTGWQKLAAMSVDFSAERW